MLSSASAGETAVQAPTSAAMPQVISVHIWFVPVLKADFCLLGGNYLGDWHVTFHSFRKWEYPALLPDKLRLSFLLHLDCLNSRRLVPLSGLPALAGGSQIVSMN